MVGGSRRNRGYVDFMSSEGILLSANSQAYTDHSEIHAEIVLRKMVILYEKTDLLIEQVLRIEQNQRISSQAKRLNAAPIKNQIKENFADMRRIIQKERRAVVEEFHRIRKASPDGAFQTNLHLKYLKAMSIKLRDFYSKMEAQRKLAKSLFI